MFGGTAVSVLALTCVVITNSHGQLYNLAAFINQFSRIYFGNVSFSLKNTVAFLFIVARLEFFPLFYSSHLELKFAKSTSSGSLSLSPISRVSVSV